MRTFLAMAMLTVALVLTGCTGEGNVNPMGEGDASDSVQRSLPNVDTALVTLRGVATDGAMNSIEVQAGDSTYYFTYPDLPMDHRAGWQIDDSVEIQYVKCDNGDSVVNIEVIGSEN